MAPPAVGTTRKIQGPGPLGPPRGGQQGVLEHTPGGGKVWEIAVFGGPQVSHGGSAGGSGGGGDLIPCGRYIVVTSGSYHRRLVISKVCHIEGVSHPRFVTWEVCLIKDKSYRRFVKFATSGLTIEGFCNIESLSHQSLTIEGLSPRRFGFPKVRHIESLSQQGLTIERVSYRRFVTSKVCHVTSKVCLIQGLSHCRLAYKPY